MTAIHGKNAIIYLQGQDAEEAVAVSELNDYSIDSDFDTAETTELGDDWKTAVKGTSGWNMAVNGNFNTASQTLWNSFRAETPRKFYIYPHRSNAGQYYYGTCWVKLPTILGGGVSDKAKTSLNAIGDGDLTPIG